MMHDRAAGMPAGVPGHIGTEETVAQTASKRPVPGLWRIVLDFREGACIFRREMASLLSFALREDGHRRGMLWVFP